MTDTPKKFGMTRLPEAPEPQTPEEWAAHSYKYGVMLGSNGIGLEELMEDWPEVLENDDIMRGWRDAMATPG
jgi:hypothetical protein